MSNLGYPLELGGTFPLDKIAALKSEGLDDSAIDALQGIFNNSRWCITVEIDGGMVPVAFSREQALEIAKRIYDYYGQES